MKFLALYTVDGLKGEDPDHPNAFFVTCAGREPILRDVIDAFPLSGSFAFRFKVVAPPAIQDVVKYTWAHVTANDAAAPLYQGHLNMRVSKLVPHCKSARHVQRTRPFHPRANESESKSPGIEVMQVRVRGHIESLIGGGAKLFQRASEQLQTTRGAIASLLQRSETVSVGRYKVSVVKKIADGGFSQVFLCRHGDRNLALKCMAADDADEAFRFIRREIQAHTELTKLKHPNIVPLLASSRHPSSERIGMWDVRILMPFFKRQSLFHALMAAESDCRCASTSRKWPFENERSVLRMFSFICKGVSAMHRRGFAHRDLKTANVMLSDDGMPLLTDFGSVVSADVVHVQTRRQARMIVDEAEMYASAAYRAPELWDVECPGSIDYTKCDVWSLGCVLYATAFGRSPFEPNVEGTNSGSSIKMAVCSSSPPFPSENRSISGIVYSAAFCDFIRNRLLRRDPRRRPTAAAALKEAIELM